MKRKIRTLLCLALAVSMLVPNMAYAKKAKVKLSKTTLTLKVGQSKTLKVSGTKKKVKWSSSKKSVATVSKKGKVTAKKQGKATITAKVSNKKLKCKVTVKSKKVTNNSTSNTSKPESTPNNTTQPAGNNGDSQNDTSNKIPQMEDVPQFYGFKNYEGVELNGSSEIHLNSYSSYIEFEEKEPTIYDISQNDYLYVKLEYINKKRDRLTEIILDDSDYGTNQIYTTDASINKIVSVDTYYDEEKSAYVSDVLLKMPKTKSNSKRKITIRESSFLRELLGLTGVVDLSKAKTTEIEYNVSATPIPSYSTYFNFEQNADGTYKVASMATSDLPDVLYIPSTYRGRKVTGIGDASFVGARMKTLIIPSSIKKIGTNMTGMSGAPNLSSIIMMGYTPSLGSLSLTREQLEGGCRIYVPISLISQYRNVESGWSGYKEMMYYADRNGVITPLKYGDPTSSEPANSISVDLLSDDIVAKTRVCIGEDYEVTEAAKDEEKGICFALKGTQMWVDFSKYLTANNIKIEDFEQIEITYETYNSDGTKYENGGEDFIYGESFGKIAFAKGNDLNGYSDGLSLRWMGDNNFRGGTMVFDVDSDMYTAEGFNLQVGSIGDEQYYVIRSITFLKYCGIHIPKPMPTPQPTGEPEPTPTPPPTGEPGSKSEKELLGELVEEQISKGANVSNDLSDSTQYTWDENEKLIKINWKNCNLQENISFSGFTSLQEVNCAANDITGIDVTENTALTSLNLEECQMLKSLDVTKNQALTFLDIYYTRTESLDLTKNTALTSFRIGESNIRSLDLSHNTELTSVVIAYCMNLKTLDVTNCTKITTFDVIGCSPTIIGR